MSSAGDMDESSIAYLTFAEVEVFGAPFNLARACVVLHVGGECPTVMSSVMDQGPEVASDEQGWPSTYCPTERGNDWLLFRDSQGKSYCSVSRPPWAGQLWQMCSHLGALTVLFPCS